MSKRTAISRLSKPFKNFYSTLSSSDQNLITLIQTCSNPSQTSQIHTYMLKTGLIQIPFPTSKLLSQISLHSLPYASSVFTDIESPNLYMYNTMIRSYSISPNPQKGLLLFNQMRLSSPQFSDQFTFVSALKCCSGSFSMWVGVGIHGIVLKLGFEDFVNVKNALLRFYCVCRRIEDGCRVFDEMGVRKDLVSWNTLIGGCGFCDLGLGLFREMFGCGFGVSDATVLIVLSGLMGEGERVGGVLLGECLHGLCVKVGFLSNVNVASGLVSMYGKQGRVCFARRVFDEIGVEKDVVLWNSLIDGYAKAGLVEDALELVRAMKGNNVRLNSSSLAGLLSACSVSGNLNVGRYVHGYVKEEKLVLDAVLGTSLVDMYAKSGLLDKAIDVFDQMESKDVKSWTTMISGYGVHGEANQAIGLFHRMEDEGFVPNEVTFLAVLNSCSHGGLVEEGTRCFRKMVEVYKVIPGIEHYGCMIDLLGRAGLLEEAYKLIKGLPIEVDPTAWRALLGACRVYGDVELAERVKRELEKTGHVHPADSLALNSTYVVAGMVKEVDCDRSGKKDAGFSKVV